MNIPDLSLDDLFRDAMKVKQARAKPSVKTSGEFLNLPDPRAIWTNEENWIDQGFVALVHEDSQSILGNFRVLTHKKVAGAKRFLRVGGVFALSSIEYVTGSHWIPQEIPRASSPEHRTISEITMPVELPELDAIAPALDLNVHLYLNGITEVRLAEDSVFTLTSGGFLELPAGTNILPVLSRDHKIAIKQALEI